MKWLHLKSGRSTTVCRIDKMLEDGVLEIIQDAPKGETNYRRILRKRMK